MKKIGIVTFQNADNYGALLQAYALKTTLIQQGNVAHILNYECSVIEKSYRLISLPRLDLKDILRKTIKLGVYPLNRYIHAQFKGFRKQFLTDTPPLLPNQMCAKNLPYDLFISGSDQVFNPRITGFDENYFLAFNKDTSKNYTYAASFGLQLENLTEKERNFIQKNLAHFNRISVREKQGAEIVQALTEKHARVHVDPTLLLPKKQWKEIAILPKKKKKYVLLYLMYKDKELVRFAQRLAKAKGLPLFFISHELDIKNRVPVKHITPTPQAWLGWFLNAQYVVTNSFHGLAFSANFNKNFFLGKLPASWPVNSRLDNLLDLTSLQGRLYTNFTDNYDEPIDWTTVNQKLEQERQRALNYLKEITQ